MVGEWQPCLEFWHNGLEGPAALFSDTLMGGGDSLAKEMIFMHG